MKKQFIHKAQKDWDPTSGHDENEKTRIQNVLRKHLGINDIVFDQTIFIHKQTGLFQTFQPEPYDSKEELLKEWWVHKPDIFSKSNNLIIEIDGKWHTDTKKGPRQTRERNAHYDVAGIKYVTITPDQVNDMEDWELLTYIFSKNND